MYPFQGNLKIAKIDNGCFHNQAPVVTIVSINVQTFVYVCLKLFQLPGFKKRIEEVKKRAGPEHGKVYLNLRRRKREEETPDREG